MRARRSKAAAGFTLLELLVTMVIVGLMAGVLAQTLAQAFRIDQLLATRALPAQSEALRAEWIRQALDSLQPPDLTGRDAFQGDARSLAGTSGNPIADSPAGYGQIELAVRFDSVSGQTTLTARMPGHPDPVALLTWPGQRGGFSYLDRQGNRFDRWPPPLAISDSLPAVIVLETGLDGAPIVAAPLIESAGRPSLHTVEQL